MKTLCMTVLAAMISGSSFAMADVCPNAEVQKKDANNNSWTNAPSSADAAVNTVNNVLQTASAKQQQAPTTVN